MYLIPTGEALDDVVFMFPYALDQIRRHAYVKRPFLLACHQVDAWLLHCTSELMDSGVRRNDDLQNRFYVPTRA